MSQDEAWSWGKLGRGPFVGKNYAKAAVIGFCQLVILLIVGCIVFSFLQLRGCQRQAVSTKIGSNTGTLNQVDSHDETSIVHYHLPLSDLFNWFGSRSKIEKKKD